MGEKQNGPFQLSFNASLKVGFQGSRVTSDGGLPPGARTRRAARLRRIDRTASDGLPREIQETGLHPIQRRVVDPKLAVECCPARLRYREPEGARPPTIPRFLKISQYF